VPLLEEAVANYERLFGRGVWHSLNVIWLGEGLMLSNRFADANSTAERALSLTRKYRHRICEPWALWLLGEIVARRDPPDARTAENYYQQALALAEELGMRPLAAYSQLGLGKLLRRSGKREDAHQRLIAASALGRNLNMEGWLKEVESEVPEHG